MSLNEEKKDDDASIHDAQKGDSFPHNLEPSYLLKLTTLNLNRCNLKEIPSSITKYATNLKKLDIGDNPRLSTLPSSLCNLHKLEILFASNCPGIATLPPVLGKMTSITRLGWKSGSLTSLPHASIPPNVVHLILTNNFITDLDDEMIFTKLKHVRKLMLSHNSITSLSEKGVSLMHNLELLRLSGNNLHAVPDSLWTLPKLSWLTISGNPNLNLPALTSRVPMVDLSSLDFHSASGGSSSSSNSASSLGQGASGLVVRATYNNEEVAVKRIRSVTSDGRPEDELKSYGALDENAMKERMVGALALFHDDVKDESGIIMKILPEGVVDLAQPPTIVEVTADRWDEDEKFSMSFIVSVLKDIAHALYYLHYNVGIVHGDVYAHNIKVDKRTGRAYLLDLGASYAPDETFRKKAEMLEVRAFGVLIGDMLGQYDEDDNSKKDVQNKKETLSLLRDKCYSKDVFSRPLFEEIVSTLSTI